MTLCALISSAAAQPHRSQSSESDLGAERSLPVSLSFSFERTQLPAGERMGLLGGLLLFEVQRGWWVGPAVYGAATGERAGLFVGGLEVQRRWSLGRDWWTVLGLSVGGGGGGAAPVGDGLMLRPSISLLKDFGAWQAGVSWSDTRFPDGAIRRSPWGLVVGWTGHYRHLPADDIGEPLDDIRTTGFGIDEIQGLLSRYALQNGSDRHVGLVGARLIKHRGWLAWELESSAAAQGGAAGYMEILGGVSAHQPLTSKVNVGARASLGLGGGGGLASGGGGLGKLGAFVSWQMVPGWRLGLEADTVRGSSGGLKASSIQLQLATDLQPRGRGASPVDARGSVGGFAWTGGIQRISHARRTQGPEKSIDLITGRFERHTDRGLYWALEAGSAFGGGAGAFSSGLFGVGMATQPQTSRSWQWGADLMVGAAGGGGVATGGGGLWMARGWAALPLGHWSHLRFGLGHAQALRGHTLSSPVLEASFSHRFGLGVP